MADTVAAGNPDGDPRDPPPIVATAANQYGSGVNTIRPVALRDRWVEWLLHRRHGGDAEQLRRTLEFLGPIRDRVIANARLSPGDVVLDVGAGDGLIGFAALEVVGPTGRVIFDEISEDLLAHLRQLAASAGVLERCDFVLTPAEDLVPIADASVDAVTLRSVLIYVERKSAALQSFYRVLRSGGRLSIFEPINRFGQPRQGEAFGGYDVAPVKELYDRVQAVYETLPTQRTMLDFDERTLLEMIEGVGFTSIKMSYEAEIGFGKEIPSWDRMMRSSPNPLAPTGAEAIAQALTPQEAERYVSHMRPLLESGPPRIRSGMVYVVATK